MTHFTYSHRRLLPLLVLFITVSGCSVYTVDRRHLETRLRPNSETAANGHKGLGLNKLFSVYKAEYNNHLDTLQCADKIGKTSLRRLKYDSKITVITTSNKSIRFYAKTLYIWKDEYLIGERSTPTLHGPKCVPIKLKDIARIEVRG